MGNKLKIALIGYGKMGIMIEKVAISRGHHIVAKISSSADASDWGNIAQADVAIEFTKPESAVRNIKRCFETDIPVVVGTTGWYDHFDSVSEQCKKENKSLLTASNFSLGVNLFFHINKVLAQAMNKLDAYDVHIEEIHHTQKLDAPSGTAITIAEGILSEIERKSTWALIEDKINNNELAIQASRKDDVPGTHTVIYNSEIDSIEIKHTAHNRSGFALGAVIAAEYLHDKKGLYTMQDIIGF